MCGQVEDRPAVGWQAMSLNALWRHGIIIIIIIIIDYPHLKSEYICDYVPILNNCT